MVIDQGDPEQSHGAAPILKIVLPDDGTIYRPDEGVAVECELTIPDGTPLPADVQFRLVDRQDREVSNRRPTMRPGEGDGKYVLVAQFHAPKRAGQYRLDAFAVSMVIRTESEFGEANNSTRITHAPPMRIIVK